MPRPRTALVHARPPTTRHHDQTPERKVILVPLQRDRSARILRGSRRIRPTVLALEDRLLLSTGGTELTLAADPPAIASQVAAVNPLPIAQAQAAGLSAWMSGLNHPLVAP